MVHLQTLNNRPEAAAHQASQPTSSQHFPLTSCSRHTAQNRPCTEALVFPNKLNVMKEAEEESNANNTASVKQISTFFPSVFNHPDLSPARVSIVAFSSTIIVSSQHHLLRPNKHLGMFSDGLHLFSQTN